MLLIRLDTENENARVPVDGPKAGHVYDALQLDYRDFSVLMKMPVPELGNWLATWVLGFTIPGGFSSSTVGDMIGDRRMTDPERKFVQAMYRLGREARDLRGLPCVLHVGALTSEALAESAAKYVEEQLYPTPVMAELAASGDREGIKAAEARSWRNLALLAEATAAAIEAGR